MIASVGGRQRSQGLIGLATIQWLFVGESTEQDLDG